MDDTVARLNDTIGALQERVRLLEEQTSASIGQMVAQHFESLADSRIHELSERLSEFEHMKRFTHPEMMCVRPPWRPAGPVEAKDCFLSMPVELPCVGEVWAAVHRAAATRGLGCVRAMEFTGDMIMEDVWRGICRARFVGADITGRNANVMLEIGIADVLGKHQILQRQLLAPLQLEKLPANLNNRRLIDYDTSPEGLAELTSELIRRLVL